MSGKKFCFIRRRIFTRKSCSARTGRVSRAVNLTLILLTAVLLCSCAAILPPSPYSPRSINEVRFRDRAQSQADSEIRVSVAVPTAEEAKSLFQTDLLRKEIQPVWVKVDNHSSKTYYLFSTATDPNYFSPLEAAYSARGGLFASSKDEKVERYFRSSAFRNPIWASTSVSGFIFTNLDEGEKVVQITLVAAEQVKLFTFFIQIPGMRVDYQMEDFSTLYPEEEIADLDDDMLRAALERLPCCTTDREGTTFGDPVNLAVIGDFKDITAAFARQGWLPAEETYANAVWKTIKSFLFRSRYRYSPVSPLYFYGRDQEFARQKPRHDVHERNHLRLWRSPMRYSGIKESRSLSARSAVTSASVLRSRPAPPSPTRSIPISTKRVIHLSRTWHFHRCLPKSALSKGLAPRGPLNPEPT